MPDTILVTGGAGFIGAHTTAALLAAGHRVRVYDLLTPPVHPEPVRPPWLSRDAELVIGDVRDVQALAAAMAGVDRVLHLAAYQDYMPDHSKFFAVNAAGTAAVYEAAAVAGTALAKVVVASSQAAYGEGAWRCPEHGEFLAAPRNTERLGAGEFEVECPVCGAGALYLPCSEDRALRPASAYGASKLAQEVAAMTLSGLLGVPTTCLRYSIVQGRYQSPSNPYSGACRVFVLRNLAGRPAAVFEDGGQRRDYVAVADVVAANLLALFDPRTDAGVYNVGGPAALTTLEYAELVARVTGGPAPVLAGEYRLGDTRHAVSGSERLRELGWAPRGTAEASAADYAAWAREMGFEDRSDAALARMRSTGTLRPFSSVW